MLECRSLSLHMPPRKKTQSRKAKADADAKANPEHRGQPVSEAVNCMNTVHRHEFRGEPF